MTGEPADLDFEDRDRRRIRGPQRAPKHTPKAAPTRPVGVQPYKAPTYHERIYGDVVAALPQPFIPTPKRPSRPTIQCAGIPNKLCKTIIDAGRNRVRCLPCAADMHQYRMSERAKAKRAAAKKAKEEQHG